MADDRVSIAIPRPLYERLSRVVGGTGANSVSEFVVHLLEELPPIELEAVQQRLAAVGNEVWDGAAPDPDASEGYSEAERDEVAARLASLGYIE
jgi:hypothetical protein